VASKGLKQPESEQPEGAPTQFTITPDTTITDLAMQLAKINRSQVYLGSRLGGEDTELIWDFEERMEEQTIATLEIQIRTDMTGKILEFIAWDFDVSGHPLPPTYILFLFALVNARLAAAHDFD
jgi:hypothetical protein